MGLFFQSASYITDLLGGKIHVVCGYYIMTQLKCYSKIEVIPASLVEYCATISMYLLLCVVSEEIIESMWKQ